MIRVGLYCWFNTSLLCKFAFTWKLCGQCEKIQDHSEKRVFYPPKNLDLQLDTFNKIERKNLPLEKLLSTNVFWHLWLDTFDNLIEKKNLRLDTESFCSSSFSFSLKRESKRRDAGTGKRKDEILKKYWFYVVWEWNWIYMSILWFTHWTIDLDLIQRRTWQEVPWRSRDWEEPRNRSMPGQRCGRSELEKIRPC